MSEKPVELVEVKIPAKDLMRNNFPTVSINGEKYEAGRTYKVTPARKEAIDERIACYTTSVIRLQQAVDIDLTNMSIEQALKSIQ